MFPARNMIAASLALYIFSLVLVPCNDHYTLLENKVLSHDHHSHQDQDSTRDTCSPFCSCACCSTLIILNCEQAFEYMVLTSSREVLPPSQFPASFFMNEFWKPPRLS